MENRIAVTKSSIWILRRYLAAGKQNHFQLDYAFKSKRGPRNRFRLRGRPAVLERQVNLAGRVGATGPR
jgi:hypothetical protein